MAGDFKKIGSLWKTDRGKAVLSGTLEDGRKVYIFKNDKGDNEKRPDYVIKVKTDGQQEPAPADQDAWGSRAPADVESEDIPF